MSDKVGSKQTDRRFKNRHVNIRQGVLSWEKITKIIKLLLLHEFLFLTQIRKKLHYRGSYTTRILSLIIRQLLTNFLNTRQKP